MYTLSGTETPTAGIVQDQDERSRQSETARCACFNSASRSPRDRASSSDWACVVEADGEDMLGARDSFPEAGCTDFSTRNRTMADVSCPVFCFVLER